MTQRMMIHIEVEKNGNIYTMQIPIMNQQYSEAHEASLEFSKQIVEMELLSRKAAEESVKPTQEVTPEVVEPTN